MFNHEEYLSKKDSMSFDEAIEIYNDLSKGIDINDEISIDLYSSLIESAVKYVEIRNRWLYLSKEEKEAIDSTRTSLHNAYMSTLAPLSRYMKKVGKDVSWHEKLISGNESRKRLGDFAGYLLCINSIVAR